MATKAKKKKRTKYPCIYQNTATGKYDIKYNYTVYNPLSAKSEYRQKWIYNIPSLAEAREELDKLRTEKKARQDKNVTLEGVFKLWEQEALTQDFSPSTIRTTRSNMRMIYQFLSSDTKVKNITKQVYYDLIACLKEKYKPETVHTLNGTFRKMIALSVREDLITDNILLKSRNLRTVHKQDYRVISYQEFVKIRDYFNEHPFIRHGTDYAPKYQFLYTLLYYTGMRIGEATALRYSDIEEYSYYAYVPDGKIPGDAGEASSSISLSTPAAPALSAALTKDGPEGNAPALSAPSSFLPEDAGASLAASSDREDAGASLAASSNREDARASLAASSDREDAGASLAASSSREDARASLAVPSENDLFAYSRPIRQKLNGRRVKVTKTYLEGERKIKDTTKNYKNRTIPLHKEAEQMYLNILQEHMKQTDASKNDRIFTLTHATYNRILRKACEESSLPKYHCHEFRHTFISNMIRENVPLTVIEKVSGDVIGTIIKRYAHMFESDEVKVLNALSKIQNE